jgi:hypothetical protein
MAGVLCTYVMHLQEVKITFGVPCLGTSATHICKNGNCTSEFGIPEVHCIFGAESLKLLLWLVQFLILIISLATYFQFCRFFCTFSVPYYSSISSLLLLLVTNLLKIVALQQRLRKI